MGLMAIALAGLVAVQFVFFQNTMVLKESQFRYNVNLVMNQLDDELHRHEARERLLSNRKSRGAKERLDSIQRVFTKGWNKEHGHYSKDTMIISDDGSFKMTYSTYQDGHGGVEDVTTVMGFEDLAESLVNDLLLEDLFSGMMSMDYVKPFQTRIDYSTLDSLVTTMFDEYGIDTEVEVAIFDDHGQPVIYDTDLMYDDLISLSDSKHRVRLRRQEMFGPAYDVHVLFPMERRFVLASLWPLILTSGGLMLIILAAFAFTVFIIFKQKRLSLIKNDFINNMTHELKTPVSTIALACEALSDPDMRRVEGSADRYIKMIQDENNRLGGLVENVLQSAVVDQGELKLKKEPTDVHSLIRDVLKNFKIQVDNKGGRLISEFEASTFHLNVDRSHFVNAMTNLLDNALKYGGNPPIISIRTSDKGDMLCISVQDNGIGISKEHQRRIFDTLYRVPTGNTHDVKGFGLGLSYVKAVMEKHDGLVAVKSEQGKGSTFNLYLPEHG